jgi:hypothetical protein
MNSRNYAESHVLLDFYSNDLNFLENLEAGELPLSQIPFDFYKDDLVFQNFLFLRKSTFISSFIDNMIDVPICFRKSRSLKMRNFELPLLKFTNLLMRRGEREKVVRTIMSSFFLYMRSIRLDFFEKDEKVLN